MFGDSFTKRLSPLQDDTVRAALQAAILAHDAPLFCKVLGDADPALFLQDRLYGVLTIVDGNMVPVLVDRTGSPLPADYVIPEGMPIDMLNVDYQDGKMIATIDGEIYEGTVGDMDTDSGT